MYLALISELFQILALSKLNHIVNNLLKVKTIEFK